jgi:VWFA-related protein
MFAKRWTKKRWIRMVIAAAGAAAVVCVSAVVGEGNEIPGRSRTDVVTSETMSAGQADVSFDTATRQVTVKVAADTLSPEIATTVRPSRLQVYEDGVRRQDVTVGIEHLPLTLGVLIEMGGRSHELADLLEGEAPYLVAPLLDRLRDDDRLGVFTYDRELRPVIDFGAARETWRPTLDRVKAPAFSEANFYDATIALLNRMTAIAGRRAIIVLTTGNDTFSRTSFDDVVARARAAHIPIYCLTLDDVVRSRLIDISHGPLARVDWPRSAARLAQLARVSGGRVYDDVRSMSASAIYDDILERLRIQYELTYVSPASGGDDRVVEVRVSGVNDAAAAGRASRHAKSRAGDRVIAQARYRPANEIARVS